MFPVGADRSFTHLSAVEKRRRVDESFGALFSDADDKALKGLGKVEADLLHESWLDVSLLLPRFTFAFLTHPSYCSSPYRGFYVAFH